MVSMDKTIMKENNDVGKPTTAEVLPDHVQLLSDAQSWL